MDRAPSLFGVPFKSSNKNEIFSFYLAVESRTHTTSFWVHNKDTRLAKPPYKYCHHPLDFIS
jgi:hypothetical protein